MPRQLLATLVTCLASCSVVFGQQLEAFQPYQFDSVVRGQSPEVMPVDNRRSPDLTQIPEYRGLLDELEKTQSELERLQQNLATAGIEEHDDHFHFADYDMNSELFQPEGDMGGGPGGGMGDVATQSQNPVGALWMMWFQNDMKLMEDPLDGKRIFNTTVFQPVMPVQLNDTWKLINRPVFTFNFFETPNPFMYRPGGVQDPVAPADPFQTEVGFGDTMLIQWLSKTPADSKMTFGFGWNWMFPTANNDDLGTGKTSVGPSVVALYLGDKIITGAVIQQYYSIAGGNTRNRVSLMDVQYILRYRLNPMFSVGLSPNMQWDQVTEKVTMPVGFGFDSMTMTKKGMPIRWGAELQYYASHDQRSFDPEWNFRLYVSPIIQAPEWATRGLFGGGNCH